MIHVGVAETGESDFLLRFSVRDTGIGIPEDKIGILFNKFSQVDASTTRRYGGTGLGLAICKQLAELMGGGIGVTSEESKGSEFWFTVRLGLSLGMDARPTESKPAIKAANLNGRVLVAEDNTTNREVILGMLLKLGLRAEAVSNGVEAIRVLELAPYDLVLMDMRMPVIDGLEAARQIRNPQSAVLNHDIPIVALTANAKQSDRQACLAAGMNDFLPKPVRKAELKGALARWLLTDDSPISVGQIVPSTTAEDSPILFDRGGVLDRLEGDEELASIVFAAFLEDIPGQIHALKDLVESGDSAAAARTAHSIRGAAANAGGEALLNLASEMEKTADGGDLSFITAHMSEMEIQFGRLKDAIEISESALRERNERNGVS